VKSGALFQLPQHLLEVLALLNLGSQCPVMLLLQGADLLLQSTAFLAGMIDLTVSAILHCLHMGIPANALLGDACLAPTVLGLQAGKFCH